MELPKRRPFVGHDDTITRIRDILRDVERGGILVDGDSGLGKTALARRALEDFEGRVFWVHPDRVLTAVPFGGLAGILDLPGTDVPSETELTRRLLSAFGAAPGERPVVVVDDAHSLDRQSLAVLAQMVTSGAIRLVALSRRHPAVPEPFLDLVYDRVLVRITLGRLERAEADLLARQILGDTVSWRALDVMYRLSCGNPAVLSIMVLTAAETGRLVNRGGVWLFDGRPVEFDQRLDDVVTLGLSELSAQERLTLELVVLAGEVPVAVLLAMGHGTGTDALVLGGLLEVTPGPNPRVRVVNALHSTVMAQAVPQGRSRRMRRAVETLMTAPKDDHTAWLAWTRWSLDCGVAVPDADLLAAARAAMRTGAYHLAGRFLTSIPTARLTVPARLDLAHLYYHMREPLIASDLLRETLGEVQTLHDAMDAVFQAYLIELTLGVTERSDPTGRAAWAAMLDRVDAPEHESEPRAWGRRLLGARADLLAGVGAIEYSGVRDRVEDETWPLPVRLLVAANLGAQECYAGRSDAGLPLIEKAVELSSRLRAPVAPLWSLHVEALARAGDFTRLDQVIEEGAAVDSASAVAMAGSVEYAKAVVHRGRGEWDEALVRARAAVEALQIWDPAGELPRALGLAAYVASVVRDTALVDRYLEALEGMDFCGPAAWWIPAKARELTVRYLRQGGVEVLEELVGLAARAGAEGLTGIEAEVWLLAFGVGAEVDLDRMAALSDESGDVLPGLATLVARALLAEDVAVLLSVAQAQEATHPLLASQTLVRAKRLARASDDPDDRSMVRQSGRAAPDEAMGVTLSTRERQVSELIAAGMTNNEIADYLKIATRTVEGHIYRLFRKLGVTRRSAVADALREASEGQNSSSQPVEISAGIE